MSEVVLDVTDGVVAAADAVCRLGECGKAEHHEHDDREDHAQKHNTQQVQYLPSPTDSTARSFDGRWITIVFHTKAVQRLLNDLSHLRVEFRMSESLFEQFDGLIPSPDVLDGPRCAE